MQKHLCVLSDVANRRVGPTLPLIQEWAFLRRQQSQQFESEVTRLQRTLSPDQTGDSELQDIS